MNLLDSIVYRINQLPHNQAKLIIKELIALKILENRAEFSENPLTTEFQKFFSQSDEDIIINKILNRVGPTKKSFIEFGPGDGLENNTISLLAKGWEGIWVGAQDLQVELSQNSKLIFLKEWIDLNSIKKIIPLMRDLNPFLISMDLDGNDYYIMEYILKSNIHPKIIIQEYNGNIPPDVEWIQNYNPNHNWNGTNYYGASYRSYVKLYESFGYRLLCCNLTGVNAFFIKSEFKEFFLDIPENIDLNFVYPLGIPYKNQSLQNKGVIQEIIDKLI